MKIKKMLLSLSCAAAVLCSSLSAAAYAATPSSPQELPLKPKMSSSKYYNYSVTLPDDRFFDINGSDNSWFKKLAIVYRASDNDDLYEIKGYYLDNLFTDRVATYINGTGFDAGCYHSAGIKSGSTNKWTATKKGGISDYTDYIDLKSNNATFSAEVYWN